ncbi:MAG: DUF2235 domain-containing protein [Methylocystis sp.]|uniref:DUF2235 domain-containing protein n=1 Tax=Methylocystis sp. TaxID=1911079 RepID=UPI003954C0A2
MAKKLVIFCDGTWNKLTERSTNVLRTLQAIESSDAAGDAPQLMHYIAGVGTRRGERFKGGTFGYGISNNIKDAYSFLVSNYEKNDEVYLFGFSRGAFTARSIAGLVHNLGILKRCKMPLVSIAYDHYKDKSESWRPKGADAEQFRRDYCHPWPVKIRFLGVWDTVGALGAPYGEFLGYLVDKFFGCSFHDVTLSESVDSAYHALAADERRWPFRPTKIDLTDYHRQRNKKNLEERGFPLYQQKWFPGVHSNVGGGYSQHGLSDCALEWMVDCARKNGLNIAPLDKAEFSTDRLFKSDYSEPIEKSQTLYYQLLSAAFVKAPSLLGVKSVYPRCDCELASHLTWRGEYIRPIGPDEDIDAVLQKRKVDRAYDEMWKKLEAKRSRAA